MTFDKFADCLWEDVRGFLNMWRVGHADDPKAFPAEMSDGDWYEQFLAYCATKDQDQ